jgi:hypothetical protein
LPGTEHEFGALKRTVTSIDEPAKAPFAKDETFLPLRPKSTNTFYEDNKNVQSPMSISPPKRFSTDVAAGLAAMLPASNVPRPITFLQIEDMKGEIADVGEDFSFVQELAQKYETAWDVKRAKHEDARRTRQDEHQDYTNQLFSENKIGYGDIGM